MAEMIGQAEALIALTDAFGSQLPGERTESLQRMARAIQERFSLSEGEARSLVAALVQSNTIHWITGQEAVNASGQANGTVQEIGYWQLWSGY